VVKNILSDSNCSPFVVVEATKELYLDEADRIYVPKESIPHKQLSNRYCIQLCPIFRVTLAGSVSDNKC
jgi:hypothetical protein